MTLTYDTMAVEKMNLNLQELMDKTSKLTEVCEATIDRLDSMQTDMIFLDAVNSKLKKLCKKLF